MIYTPLTIKALKLAYDAHQGQTDRSGLPYIFHPYHVAEQMQDEITTCAALLHDVVEDTEVTMTELEREFPKEVTDALKLLTYDKKMDYYEYVYRICSNPVAKAVKMADVAHNSDESRLVCSDVSHEQILYWRKKYSKARAILEMDDR